MQFRLPTRLRLTDSGFALAKRSLDISYQSNRSRLADTAEVDRSTVFRFFDQRNLSFDSFERICERLGLDWEEVGEEPESDRSPSRRPDPEPAAIALTLDDLIAQVRACVRERIVNDCASIQVFSRNIKTDSIYVPTNLIQLPQADADHIADEGSLSRNPDIGNFNRLGHASGQRISGEQAVQRFNRLFLHSKPGSGKTTYLQWLATRCNQGQIFPEYVPVFIAFKDFAELGPRSTLTFYIEQYFTTCQVPNPIEAVRSLLSNGRILLLLDGLDEVPEAERVRVLIQVRALVSQYHKCRFVVSCRPPLRIRLPGFELVTIAAFDPNQIREFARRWFTLTEQSDRSTQFMERLRRHVAIGELATTPLLLTMLCRVFNADGDFPNSRLELYKRGFDLLLREWDVYRIVERDTPYQQLNAKVKETLLSVIAANFFKRGQTLFPRREVEAVIEDFFQKEFNTNPIEIDAAAILRSIELQHGLLVSRASNYYSFSHLTFQEYLTAVCLDSQREFPLIYDHVADERWRFVIEVVAELLPETIVDDFLMNLKVKLDQTLSRNTKSQQFMRWLDQHTQVFVDDIYPEQSYPITLLRAWYFVSSLEQVGYISSFGRRSPRPLDFPDFDMATSAISGHLLEIHAQFYRVLHAKESQHDVFFNAIRRAEESLRSLENIRLKTALDEWQFQIEQQLSNYRDRAAWWSATHHIWKQRVRQFMNHHYQLRCDWSFTEDDRALLQQYYNATKLLAECINRSPRLSPHSFHRIASSLLRLDL
ncbi:MAG: NACHT domain-containing protein [Kaiparowitsia implicata GSE-PSE-MK54-09C]|jgi:hypothetical protein|nr:NACHT domain-containing protein [Kaiparowitsia implicata GSE-PSE-MK54-09C]